MENPSSVNRTGRISPAIREHWASRAWRTLEVACGLALVSLVPLTLHTLEDQPSHQKPTTSAEPAPNHRELDTGSYIFWTFIEINALLKLGADSSHHANYHGELAEFLSAKARESGQQG